MPTPHTLVRGSAAHHGGNPTVVETLIWVPQLLSEAELTDSVTDLGGLGVGAKDFLAAVLRTIAQPVWVVDHEGLIRFANPAAIATLGYDDAEDLIGRHSHETIHYRRPDGTPYPASECPMLLPRTSGATVTRDLDWFLRRDGSMFPVSYASVPLEMSDGRGAVVAFNDIESRLRAEEELRERDVRLAEEQSSLRRIASLVTGGADSVAVFGAVAREVAQVLKLPLVEMSRYEPDGTMTVIGAWNRLADSFRAAAPWRLAAGALAALIHETGEPARIDDFADVPGDSADAGRDNDIRCAAGAPIVVDGNVWGVMATGSAAEPLPPDVEDRLAGFTELVATAISSTQAREDLRRLADEQAALRRVATLVARGATPEQVFAAVAREVSHALDLPLVEMCRYEPDGTATVIGATGEHPFQPGTNWPLDGPSLTTLVRRTERPVRIDDYAEVFGKIGDAAREAGVHAGVGAPIIVDGRVWGVVSAGGGASVRLPPDAEMRLGQFTELLATAIANTQAKEELHRLAEEQSALRRLATLVARGAEPAIVFDAVCQETGRLLEVTTVNLAHFASDGFNVTMAGWSMRDVHLPTGTRLPLEGDSINVLVRDTAAPGRYDSYKEASGELAALLRKRGVKSEVGAPVVVDGRVWGALIAGTDDPEPLPAGLEHRLAAFAELIATAISNATTQTELIASRTRIVEAADEQRRRVVRDLHDGAQQRLVEAVMTLQLAQARGEDMPLVAEGVEHVRAAIAELRELARGIHPALLTHRGLAAAVEALTSRAPLPVAAQIPDNRYPPSVESAAYFVVAEALTNVAKYANAETAQVTAELVAGRLILTIEDDGVGGARAYAGSGLSGLQDRITALNGTLGVDSPAGRGTRIRAEIPLP
jgi:PAS domain S-box-containing protein